jgi:hypothetical protein
MAPSSKVNEALLKDIYGREITDEDIMFKPEDGEGL